MNVSIINRTLIATAFGVAISFGFATTSSAGLSQPRYQEQDRATQDEEDPKAARKRQREKEERAEAAQQAKSEQNQAAAQERAERERQRQDMAQQRVENEQRRLERTQRDAEQAQAREQVRARQRAMEQQRERREAVQEEREDRMAERPRQQTTDRPRIDAIRDRDDRTDRQEARQEARSDRQEARQDAVQNQQARQEARQDARETRQVARLPKPQQERLIVEQRRQAEQFTRQAQQQATTVYRTQIVELQRHNRHSQYRYSHDYYERLLRLLLSISWQNYNYYNDPYFYTPPSYRYYRSGRYYEINRYAADLLRQAINYGYREGYRAGRADREDGWRPSYRDSFAYRDASYGYRGFYVSYSEYRYYFREGFRRGYEDGYYGRYRYGRYYGGNYSILSTSLSLILNLQPYHYRYLSLRRPATCTTETPGSCRAFFVSPSVTCMNAVYRQTGRQTGAGGCPHARAMLQCTEARRVIATWSGFRR